MNIKKIEAELQNGKNLKDALSESDTTLEELLMKVLKDNEELRERIEHISKVLIDMRTPW